MKLENKYSAYIWISIIILMVLGFLTSLIYWIFVYSQMGSQSPSCGCRILTKNELIYIFIEYKASIFGIKPIYLSLSGFLIGAVVSFLALRISSFYKIVFTISATLVSTTYIPYLISLLISHNIFCIYCTIMQGVTITSALLSISDLILSYS